MIPFVEMVGRLIGYGLAAFVAALAGAFVLHFLGDIAFEWIMNDAPDYPYSLFPWAVHVVPPPGEYARFYALIYLLMSAGMAGFFGSGVAAFVLLFFRLGGFVAIIQSFAIMLAGGLLGGLLGWGVGYLMGMYIPDFLRGLAPWGNQPWFNPLHMGIGLGIAVGVVIGIVVGAVVSVVSTWAKVREGSTGR